MGGRIDWELGSIWDSGIDHTQIWESVSVSIISLLADESDPIHGRGSISIFNLVIAVQLSKIKLIGSSQSTRSDNTFAGT